MVVNQTTTMRFVPFSFSVFVPNFSLNFQIPNPNFIIRCLSSSNYSIHDHDDLVTLFNQLLNDDPTPPIFQFGKILGSLVKSNHFHTVVSLSQQLELKGIKQDLINCNILINSFCQLGHIPFAFSVFTKILKTGYDPNAITFTTLIKGLCLTGDIHQALNFHYKVVAEGFDVDHYGYGTIINGLCKVGDTRAALRLLRQVVEPDVVMFTTVIDSMCKDTFVDDAFDLYSEMVANGISPNVVTYTALIDGFYLVGKLEEAIGLF